MLGAALGLRRSQLVPFLVSLRRAGYRGDIALVVDGRLARLLREDTVARGVTLLTARRLFPVDFLTLRTGRFWSRIWPPIQIAGWALVRLVGRLPGAGGLTARIQSWIAELICTPMEARFLRFQRYLDTHPHRRVLICDVRDVIFQRDPFIDLPVPGLAVSVEVRRYTVGSEPLNAKWIRDAYGEDLLDRIGANPVTCVGVTYGDRSGMTSYLRLMRSEILRLTAAAARRGGADTAIHNYLVWTGRLDQVQLLETLGSPVATLNGIPEEEISISAEGRILNRDGSEPSVVHQYDRLPGVAERLLPALTAD